jgi:hypothetical protein
LKKGLAGRNWRGGRADQLDARCGSSAISMGGAAMKPDLDEREAHETGDTLPEQAGVYVPPRPIPSLSDHRTMDVKAIRIAAEHDPRQALTQLRMQPPPRRRSWAMLIGVVSATVGLGSVLYLGLMSSKPLPLAGSTAASPAVPPLPPAPTVSPPPVEANLPPPALPPSVVSALPSATSTGAARPPKAVKGGTLAAPHPRRGPTPSAKVSRDPWLE